MPDLQPDDPSEIEDYLIGLSAAAGQLSRVGE